ncbi:CDP-diacylglycerol--serine O-phosphatidyltransferase [Thioalkalivibrio sp. HK1]|uniref:CDP-diacylglycerol--serine O-phosphatidyltransferase n=1 Tax=Thioalkalivibrio sp. HK1 TaxID=1469245 RepID=UPI000470F057|nr:CDP-diacylglycerol--serine O-phosphatidyltransferase [Thioalkalivibrio sp. HK1]
MSDPSGEGSSSSDEPLSGHRAGDSSERDPHPKIPRRRGIYLLPNLFTTAALFSGFYAIVAATDGRYESAAIAIFVAMVLDGVDGRIARMTGTQSNFGAEYDSLSDVISFGLAPSLLLYESVLAGMGKPGWVAAFFYTAATALRLARFNVQVGSTDKRYFQGLPCPAAAAVLAGLVWFVGDHDLLGPALAPFAFAITIATGALMVSRFRFHSFKNLDLRGQVPFSAIFAVVLLFVLVSSDPPLVLFLAALAYAGSGPLLTLLSLRRRRARRRGMSSSSYDIDPG